MKQKISIFLINIVITAGIWANTNQDSVFVNLTALQCDSLIAANDTNPRFVILDVRTYNEYNPEHLKYAINIDYNSINFEDMLIELNKGKVYLIHCLSGGRSGATFEKMRNLGFSEVYNMLGGINAWKAAELPVTDSYNPLLAALSDTQIVFSNTPVNTTDTLNFTITNSGNGVISFSGAIQLNNNDFSTNFIESKYLSGGHDYTFSIYYHPTEIEIDCTSFLIESNGGSLEISLKGGGIPNAIQKSSSEMFAVYPNPITNNSFSIRNFQNVLAVCLYDVQGKEVTGVNVTNQNKIYLPTVQKGIYILQIRSEKGIFVQKIVIE